MIRSISHRPTTTLLVVLPLNLLAACLATWLALTPPWLGLHPQVDGTRVRAGLTLGPSAEIPTGATLVSLRGLGESEAVDLLPVDLTEEPDVAASYADMASFFSRQSLLARHLAHPGIELTWRQASSLTRSLVVPAARPLADLPAGFWFQLGVAMLGCLIACWVWILRPRDPAAVMFAVTGVAFPLFAFPAAIYSSRELALSGALFTQLSSLNHFGAVLFGTALVGIFLCHPRPLIRPRHLPWLFLAYGTWWLLDASRLAPDLDWGHRYAVMSQMLGALGLAGWQWFRARGAPLERAALRWFILSLLLGSGLFILSMVASISLGWLPPIPQGYAFGFFLLIYLGIALGIGRYRLFDLDEWAYRILLWVGGASLVASLDAMLILGLGWQPELSLGLTLLIAGWLYFPARQWLWQHVAHRPSVRLHELLPDVVEIAFQPARSERSVRWRQLLERLLAPLECLPDSADNVELIEDGLGLRIPPCGGLDGVRLRFAQQGRRLFTRQDQALASALCQLMDQAEASRLAHEQGLIKERQRIARDMHDDVGARLLTLIHRAEHPDVADIARAAMRDLRSALSALDSRARPLRELLHDWHAEAGQRCEAAGVTLHWLNPDPLPDHDLLPGQRLVLERGLREGLTNALKHAHPTVVKIEIGIDHDQVRLSVTDDGTAPPPDTWVHGRGLRGLGDRLQEHEGRFDLTAVGGGGSRLCLSLALR
ncbi:MAG: sensor histidine kinase [Pseudomonadota bacterium]